MPTTTYSTYTTPSTTYTFTVPSCATFIEVECWGAGGGGGGNATANKSTKGASGGGGGAYSKKTISVTPGQTYTLTVGKGGSAGGSSSTSTSDGGTGTDSYLGNVGGTLVLAKGGIGGKGGYNASRPGGAGGAGGSCIGDISYSGGSGGAGSSNTNSTDEQYGGGGGSSAGRKSDGNTGKTSARIDDNNDWETFPPGGAAPGGGVSGGKGGSDGEIAGAPGVGDTGGGGGGGSARNEAGAAGGDGKIVITWGYYYFYNSSNSWTCPAGVTSVSVHCWGAGGGGGGGSDKPTTDLSDGGAGGGGGGAYSRALLTVVPGTTYSVNIGSGGSGGINAIGGAGTNTKGGTGGDSWFSLTGSTPTSTSEGVLADGGAGGAKGIDGSSVSGGSGGSSSNCIGAIKFSGGDGASSCGGGWGNGGGGGSSAGTGQKGVVGTTPSCGSAETAGAGGTAPADGSDGATGGKDHGYAWDGADYGAGGGGAGETSDGGRGANGQVVIVVADFSAISNSQTICSGSTPATLTVTVLGDQSSYTFVWQSSTTGTASGFATATGTYTNSTYTLSPVTTSSLTSTWYRVVSTRSGCNTYTSTPVVIVFTPTITASVSSNQSICTGTSPSALTSSATGGTGSYTYIWQSSTTSSTSSFSDIGGATLSTYAPGTLSTQTWYRAVVSSVCTTSTSPISISMKPSDNVEAGGPSDNMCSTGAITLSGSSFGGAASTAAWSITSGSGSLSSTSQTASPSAVSFTPSGTGTVVLTLATDLCATDTRTLTVISCTTQTISTGTSSWTAPCGVTTVTIQCWGGGGGGGAAVSTGNTTAGGGGGGGAYSYTVATVVPGTSYSLYVGKGGTGGTTNTGTAIAGEDTWFFSSATLKAVGGNPGNNAANNTAAAGGTKKSTGNIGATAGYYGGSGSVGISGTGGGGGGGGAGSGGDGSNATSTRTGAAGGANGGVVSYSGGSGGTGPNSNGNGGTGQAPGGGGAGGYRTGTGTGNGGNGADGQVIITYPPNLAVTLSSSNPAVSATSGICANSTDNQIYAFTLGLNSGGSSRVLDEVDFVSAGAYIASDILNFKLLYNTTNSITTATTIATISSSLGSGSHSFTGLNTTLTASATSYFWITTDASSSPSVNSTISVNALTTNDISMTASCYSKTGTAYASGTFTLSTSTVRATAIAGGGNSICSTDVLQLTGAAIGGSATTGTWSITGGSGTLSYTTQTADPSTVTFTPSTVGSVTLTLITDGCIAIGTRNITVYGCSQTFTTSGTTSWTAPCGITSATVQCWGGGGGGAGRTTWNGGGGGGGAFSYSVCTVSSNNSYTLNVGAGGSGGAANNSGTAGGDSWFSLTGSTPASSTQGVLARGGGGGYRGDLGGGGSGGSSSTGYGSVRFNGGNGGDDGGTAGGAGGSSAGTGSNGNAGTSNTNNGAGGTAPAGGGAGGNAGSTAGGNGVSATQVGGGGGGASYNPAAGGDGYNGKVTITTASISQPTVSAGTNVSGCVGVATNICAGATATYTNNVVWTTVNGTGVWTNSTSATAATYQPSAADASLGSVKLIFTTYDNSSCNYVGSIKTFSVIAAVSATVNSAQTICTGSSPSSFSITATGGNGSYTYSWQSSSTNATTGFISASGTYTNSTYSPGNLSIPYWFRCIVSSSSCTSYTTAAVATSTVTALGGSVSSAQTICTGSSPSTLTVTASGGTSAYTYQWQSSTDNSTFSNVSGATSNSYSPGSLSANTWYRNIIGNSGCTSYTTSAVKITVESNITATVTADQTICSGGTPAAFSVSASGGSGSYTYTWESSTAGTASGFNVISGETSASYTSGALTVATWFRSKVSGGACATASSSSAKVSIQSGISGNTVQSAQTICNGATPTALTESVAASGGGGSYTYQWQSSTDNSSYSTIGGATSYTYAPGTLATTTYYRRVVSTALCTGATSHTSTAIQITVLSSIGGNVVASAQTICNGDSPSSLTESSGATGGGNSYTYQWQSSTDNSSYSDIASATSSGYAPGALTVNTWYQRVVSTAACSGSLSHTSTAVKITVQTVLSNYGVSQDQQICSGFNPAPLTASGTIAGGDGATYAYQWQSSTDNSSWSNIGAATSSSYAPGALSANTWYRRVATSGACTATSTAVAISMGCGVAADQTICSGASPANFAAATSGSSYTYVWQTSTTNSTTGFSSGPGTYTNSTYNPGATSVATWVRCVSSYTCASCTYTSTAVSISIGASALGGTVANSQTICTGATPATFTLTPSGGNGYTYQWQSSVTNSTSTFSDIGGATSATYSPGALAADTWYRGVVGSGGCTSYTTTALHVTIGSAVSGSVASAQTVCNGGTPSAITVTPSGGSGTYAYTWQISTTNSASGFVTASGTYTNNSYSPGTLSTTTWYNCIIASTGGCTSYTTAAIEITVQPSLGGNSVNAAQTICTGSTPAPLTQSSAATGGGAAYTYQWQESTDNISYSNISGATSSGYSPSTLTVNTWYRRVVSTAACSGSFSHTSTAVKITVESNLSGNVVGADQTYCTGSFPDPLAESTPVSGGSGSYTYVWEISTTSSTTNFSNAPGTYTTNSYSSGALTTTSWFRRVASGGACTSITSNVVMVTIQQNLSGNVIAAAQTICTGSTPSGLTESTAVTGGNGSYTYEWQESTTGSGSGFATASGTSNAVGYTPGTLTTTTWYQRIVSGGLCSTHASNVIEITVESNLGGNTIAANQTICNGDTPAPLTQSFAATGGSGSYSYQWQVSTDNSTYNDIGSATSSGYSPGALTADTWYKRVVSAGTCASHTSTAVKITVLSTIAGNTISSTETICHGDSRTLSGAALSGGNGTYTYVWEESVTGSSSGFANATGTYTNSTYSTGALTADTWYRRIVSSSACSGSFSNTSNVVAVTVVPSIGGNTISTAQTICTGSAPVDLTELTAATGGGGSYSYQWQQSTIGTSSGFGNANGTNNNSDYSPGTLTSSIWYRRVVSTTYCTGSFANTSSTVVEITVEQNLSNNTISSAQIICKNTVPSSLSGTAAVGGSGSYTYLWEESTTSSSSGFGNAQGTNNTQNYTPGTLASDTWYRRIVSSGVCANSTSAVLAVTVQQNSGSVAYWNGNTDSDWNTSGNWCGTPSCSVSAIIPSGMPNSPVISADGASCLSLTINSGATLTMSSTNTLGLCGDWINNGTFTPGSGVVHFIGSGNQSITGSGAQSFYDLVINNSGSTGNDNVTLNQPATVTNTLTLTDGILVTTSTNLLTLSNSATNATTGGNSTGPSFVKGPMRWNGLTGAGPWIFPTGKGTNKWARVAVSNVTPTAPDVSVDFTCEYFNNAYSNIGSADLATTPTPTLIVVSGYEYWDVTRTSGTGSGSAAVTLYWEDAAASGITSCTDLLVAHYPLGGSNKWENQGNAGTTGSCTGNGSGSIKGTVQTSFSPETFGDAAPDVNPLPIELLYFDATYNGKSTDIKWATATEINSDYFTIERSTDGIHFYPIAVVPSLAEGGNSTSTLYYTYVDLNYEPGTYYYRIKQTDFDGQFQYTSVKAITIKGYAGFSFEIAPNPNNGNQITMLVNALKNETITLNIYDMLGQIVYTNKYNTTEDGNNVFPLQIQEKLRAGVYIFTATPSDEQQAESRKVIVE